MSVQVILRDGAPEYAVLPWQQYQALLQAANGNSPQPASAAQALLPALGQLKSLREQRGLSLEQLARSVGISPAYLGMIENAERSPDAAIRRSLAMVLEQPGWSDDS